MRIFGSGYWYLPKLKRNRTSSHNLLVTDASGKLRALSERKQVQSVEGNEESKENETERVETVKLE